MAEHTDELAGLSAEVREAVNSIDHVLWGRMTAEAAMARAVRSGPSRDWRTVRAELLRLAGENAELRTVNAALETAERRYERAEAELAATMERITAHGFAGGPSLDACVDAIAHELAALKRKIAEAQQTTVAWSGGYGCRLDVMADMPVGESPIIGKRVALLPVGGDRER